MCVHALSHFNHVWLFPTLWTVAPGSSVHGILQARIWSGLPCLPPGNLPDPEIEPESPASPAWEVDSWPLCQRPQTVERATFTLGKCAGMFASTLDSSETSWSFQVVFLFYIDFLLSFSAVGYSLWLLSAAAMPVSRIPISKFTSINAEGNQETKLLEFCLAHKQSWRQRVDLWFLTSWRTFFDSPLVSWIQISDGWQWPAYNRRPLS